MLKQNQKIMLRVLLLLLASTGLLSAQNHQDYISVSGSATKQVNADQLILSMGISLTGHDAEKVFNESSEIYNKGLEALRKRKKQCTFSTDIVRLSTNYGYRQQKGQEPQSFETKQSIEIIITDMEAYGEIVSELLEIGFNQIRSTRFAYSKPEELKKEVLAMAIDAGKSKAKYVADAMDVNLGRVRSFRESRFSSYTPSYSNVVSRAEAGGSSSIDVEAGMVNITLVVDMTFAIDHTPTVPSSREK